MNKQEEEKKIVWDLIDFNSPLSQQSRLYSENTGKSRATFYRIKKKQEIETSKKIGGK